MLSQDSGLFPLAVFLAILLFALLAWCILSSCMGRSILSGISELWEMVLLGARSGSARDHVRYRAMGPGSRLDDDELYEMESRRSHLS